jgi:hypothetical protein
VGKKKIASYSFQQALFIFVVNNGTFTRFIFLTHLRLGHKKKLGKVPQYKKKINKKKKKKKFIYILLNTKVNILIIYKKN